MAAPKSPHYWLVEPLLDEPSLIERRMFGCDAVYLHGRLQLVLCPGDEEPWAGVLVPTDKEFHPALIRLLPKLTSHPVLGKWLYISQFDDAFERTVMEVVREIALNNMKIGVVPQAKAGIKSKKRRPGKREQ